LQALDRKRIPFRSPNGEILAYVDLLPFRSTSDARHAPLIEITELDAAENGESVIQLKESERYEYLVVPLGGTDWRLRCSLSTRRKSLGDAGMPDAGLLETKSFCGTLLLELVEGLADQRSAASATALLDVRSLKLDYRTEYRGMLRRLSEELAGLVVDARQSAKVGFYSNFKERTDEGWLQIQLELLREVIDSSEFRAAMQRILKYPHERVSTELDTVPIGRPMRYGPAEVRQLLTGSPRQTVPAGHPLRPAYGIESVARQVRFPRKSRDLDTLENQFIRFALAEFRAFLAHALGVFEASDGWGASAALCQRLLSSLDNWLAHGMFREVSDLQYAPLGSPVLQRKPGYREVLRWWLRFRTAAEISWQGGESLFRVGQRDVASLYEYWLFFELLEWFCDTCRGGLRPTAQELVSGLESGSPSLRLKRGEQLGPFEGSFDRLGRSLAARFTYNRRFEVTSERHEGGSWTRRFHPDYTLTFWPQHLAEAEAERRELLVHIHFDAKYRVESLDELFGQRDSDDADEPESSGNYKRQDLIKMHAYRDAIKRSQGAFVLYPGRNNSHEQFRGAFHEILPGLGAFGVAPDEQGRAQGIEALQLFLHDVLIHLSNRTTAQERVSFHVSEAYKPHGGVVEYKGVQLPEADIYGAEYRALPPAEHMVLVAWFNDDKQLQWTKSSGNVIVRLGERRGSWRVPPEFATTRHILLRTYRGHALQGLMRLRESGYMVHTAEEIKAKGYPGPASGDIYALFKVQEDPAWSDITWDSAALSEAIRMYEERSRHIGLAHLGRLSPLPRILPLRDLLEARANRS